MKATFYFKSLLCAVTVFPLFSCSQPDDVSVDEATLSDVFPAPTEVAPAYVEVDEIQLVDRYISHVHVGTKDHHHFAVQRLLETRDCADKVAAELRDLTTDRFTIGSVVSLCQVLGDVGDGQHAAAIIPFVETLFPPIVRTAAFQALANIAPADYGDLLIAAYAEQDESSPRDACLNALSQGGSEQGLDFIAELVEQWLDQGETALQSSWNALLLNSNPRLQQVLTRLQPRLSPFLALQSFGVRISLGDRDIHEQIKVYVDAEKYKSAGTRSLAVQLLGELQQWDLVMSLAPSHNEKLDLAIIGLLSRDDAPARAVQALDIYTQQELRSLRRKSLMQMIKLGKTSYFDSYLLELDEYPYTPGSLLALSLLTDMQGLPENVVDVMIRRWEYCDDVNHRLSLVRALVRMGYPSATDFLGEMLLNENTDPAVTKFISEVLGNSGPESTEWFLKLWEQNQDFATARVVFLALTRYPEMTEVREVLVATAQSLTIDPMSRRFVLELLHKVYPEQTRLWFAEWLKTERHSGVRAFYNHFLNSYY
jgi:HEAT repeat protein